MRDLMALWVVRFSMTAVTDYVRTYDDSLAFGV